jgi:hypothetical protein
MGFHSNETLFKPQRFSVYLHIAFGNMNLRRAGIPPPHRPASSRGLTGINRDAGRAA